MTPVIFKQRPQDLDVGGLALMEASLEDFHWGVRQLASELETNAYIHYWFLILGQSYVAYVAGQVLFGELEIVRVYTDPDCRGQGYGGLLLDEVLADSEVDTAFLEVRSQNQAALNLYRSVGFESVSTRKNYYKHPVDDAITMIWKEETDE
ncbi:ribosomal protein S18-alanine N-acetyltransferase [Aerococcaceae bacterium WGS1372]